MKKLRVLILTAIAMLALCATASAAEIGDVIGEAVYSDIGAYINHYPIKSYAIDGQTVIVAEDLRSYGCDVVWDADARSLSVTKSTNDIAGTRVFKPTQATGTHFADLLFTDIAVYINGQRVPSYAINGYTMITIEDLGAAMDGFNWSQELRAAKAWIEGKNMTEYKPIIPRTFCVYDVAQTQEWHDTDYLSGYFDFNSDGIDELYKITTTSDGTVLNISISGHSVYIERDFGIENVYICNLFGTDMWSMVVVTCGEAASIKRYVCTYSDNGIEFEKFKTHYEVDNIRYDNISEFLCTGFAYKSYFNVDANGLITIRSKGSGMWNIYKSYRFNGREFEDTDEDYYEIIPDYAEYLIRNNPDISGYERQMLNNGYVKAYKNYTSGNLHIRKGEYFSITHDDDRDRVFIKKADGNSGWIELDYWMDNLNPYFFFIGE